MFIRYMKNLYAEGNTYGWWLIVIGIELLFITVSFLLLAH
jgi:hypothetical protein